MAGAFNVPPRAARPPWAVPLRFAGLGAFPEHKVHGVLFGLLHVHPGARHHAVQGAVAQLPVVFITRDPEVGIPVGRISVACLFEVADEVDDGGELFGDPGGRGARAGC